MTSGQDRTMSTDVLADHFYKPNGATEPGTCGVKLPIKLPVTGLVRLECGLTDQQHPARPRKVAFVPSVKRHGSSWFVRDENRGTTGPDDNRRQSTSTIRCERLLSEDPSIRCESMALYQVWCVDAWVIVDDHDLCQQHAIERVERLTHDRGTGVLKVQVRAIDYSLPNSTTIV